MSDNNQQPTEYIIDATDKKLGRVATEAASLLRGKNDPRFEPHKRPTNKVKIIHASKIDLGPEKLKEEYKWYSGYPGGLKHERRDHLINRKGYQDVFEKAVYGMLPDNRQRPRIMKNLTITE